jgi:hypothetical protein
VLVQILQSDKNLLRVNANQGFWEVPKLANERRYRASGNIFKKNVKSVVFD